MTALRRSKVQTLRDVLVGKSPAIQLNVSVPVPEPSTMLHLITIGAGRGQRVRPALFVGSGWFAVARYRKRMFSRKYTVRVIRRRKRQGKRGSAFFVAFFR